MPLLRVIFRLPSKLRRKARRSRITLMLMLLITVGLLIVPFYVIYKPPGLLIRYFQYKWPEVLFHVPTTKKIIALTIDDAPSEYTDEILEILKANDAKATFFVIGAQVDGRQQALKDLVSSGNELGNHAMHDEPARSLSDEQLTLEIQSVNSQIDAVYKAVDQPGPRSLYFRPGSGFFSQRMLISVAKLGYKVVLGGIYPHDPFVPYWRINAAHVLSMARPGAIIICHDRRPWTAPMLRKVVPELRQRGYQLVTVSQLLKESSRHGSG